VRKTFSKFHFVLYCILICCFMLDQTRPHLTPLRACQSCISQGLPFSEVPRLEALAEPKNWHLSLSFLTWMITDTSHIRCNPSPCTGMSSLSSGFFTLGSDQNTSTSGWRPQLELGEKILIFNYWGIPLLSYFSDDRTIRLCTLWKPPNRAPDLQIPASATQACVYIFCSTPYSNCLASPSPPLMQYPE
jgi:hypothetical protein